MTLRSLKSHTRDHLKDEYGDIWTDPHGRPVLQRHPSSTPVHCFLTEERPHRGIILAPLPIRIPGSIESLDPWPSSTSSTASPSTKPSVSGSKISSVTKVLDHKSSNTTNVLLSIRLEKDYFEDEMSENIRIWREWIRNIPPEAKGIKIEAIYDSFSTLVLLTMPIALWDLLPNNSAYSFVGFTTSDNKVSTLEEMRLGEEQEKADLPTSNQFNSLRTGTQVPSPRLRPDLTAGDLEERPAVEILKGSHGMLVFTNHYSVIMVRSRGSKVEFGIAERAKDHGPEISVEQSNKKSYLSSYRSDSNRHIQIGNILNSKQGTQAVVSQQRLASRDQYWATTGWPITEQLPPRLKPSWSAIDVVERAKVVRQLLRQIPETQSHFKIAKLTFLYNIKIILPILRSLREVEYRLLRDANVGDNYLDTLTRCASLLEWPLVLAQVVMIQIPKRPAPLMWLSLTQSLLLDEDISLRAEQEEAEALRVELERYVETAFRMVSEKPKKGARF
jgi:hypothetical protein